MDKKFFIVIAVLVVGFFGLLFYNKNDSNNGSNANDGEAKLTSHIQGEGTSGVTVTEYADFQCPACAQYFPIVQQLKQDYGDEVAFQFRHFPLQSIHQNALISARAGEAAGMQDKFFEMHDLLFQNQQVWASSADPSQIFIGYAEQLELDVAQFRQDLRSSKVNRIVQADLAEANRKGYTGTPTFEINGEKIENPTSIEDFKELIDQAIEEQSGGEQQSGGEERPGNNQQDESAN